MQLIFRTLAKQEASLDVEESESVASVKERVAKELPAFPADKQMLIHGGKILEDEKAISDYAMRNGDHVVVFANQKPKASSNVPPPVEPTATAAQAAAAEAPAAAPDATTESTTPPVAETQQAQTGAAVEAPNEGSADLVPLEEREATIKRIEAMGFPRGSVEQALDTAFYNADRAVEYLLSGVPLSQVREEQLAVDATAPAATQQPTPVDSGPTVTPLPAPTAPPAGGAATASPLQAIRHHPMFNEMRRAIQANPHVLPQMLAMIGTQNHALADLIVHNQEEFLAMLSEPVSDDEAEGGGPAVGGRTLPPGTATVQLTHEEVEAIDRLTGLGVPRAAAIQAYVACDRNENLAANYLLDILEEEDDAAPPS